MGYSRVGRTHNPSSQKSGNGGRRIRVQVILGYIGSLRLVWDTGDMKNTNGSCLSAIQISVQVAVHQEKRQVGESVREPGKFSSPHVALLCAKKPLVGEIKTEVREWETLGHRPFGPLGWSTR